MIVALYVDDLLLISTSLKYLYEIKKQLAQSFEMKELGEAHFILGIKIERDRSNRKLTISQSEYMKNILNAYGLGNSRRDTHTPMNMGVKLVKTGLAGEPESESVEIKEYQSAVGSIMYAMLCTRPDIAYPISRLAQFSNDPRKAHWKAVMQLIRYLATTSDYCIVYDGKHDEHSQPILIGYTDSDWGKHLEDRRSVTGYVFCMAGGAISWKSRRQPTVALSTTEAEYMAACEATREAVSWRMLLIELGLNMREPTVIMSDNQGSIALTKNPEHHARSKHIDIRHHYVREQVALGSVAITYISTDNMVADVLTKPLTRDRHTKMIRLMGVRTQSIPTERRLSGSVENINDAPVVDDNRSVDVLQCTQSKGTRND